MILGFFFILGSVVGSFLNVVALRSVQDKSWIEGKSECPACKHPLASLDLVPIVSYVLLGGKCRYCQKKISIQYPLVELSTGILFLLSYFSWSLSYQIAGISYIEILYLIFILFIVSTFIVLFLTDLREGLLPNSIVLPAIAITAIFKLLFFILGVITAVSLLYDLLSAIIPALIFFLIVWISNERAMGGGDIKLVFLLGLILGWPGTIVGLFAGFLTGALVAVTLLVIGKKRFGESIPLGPFLIVGSFLALFWGSAIFDLYIKTIST